MARTVWLPVVCMLIGLASLAASGTDYFVAEDGDDANPGTREEPFATIQHAADVMAPGDVCRVSTGTYRESVTVRRSGEDGKPLRFVADPPGEVLLSGTEPIDGPWTVHEGAVYRTRVEGDFPQLFVDGRMMVEARWPNRRFPEELWDISKWATAGKGSRYGKMVDPELAKTGIDWTGARATLNVAHQFYSWTRTVTKHALGTGTFEYAKDLTGITHFADKTKPWEDDRYYLSGVLAALDAPGEWFLDTDTGTLFLWTLDGKSPEGHRVEAKRRNYAFQAEQQDHLVIEGFRMFGATFFLKDCRHCVVEDCHLSFPTYARRISDPTDEEPWTDKTLVSGIYNAVRQCSLGHSPTSGLVVAGYINVVEDCLVHDISWYGSLRDAPLRMSGTDDIKKPAGGLFRGLVINNTVYGFGNAGICFGGMPILVARNHVYDGGLCCEDVALVYTQLPTCAGSVVRYNWVHGCRTVKGWGLGIRGDDQTRGLTVDHNVVWDCGRDGIIVKGDNNTVCNNTVFDIGTPERAGNYVNLHTAPEPKKPWRKQYPLLERQNANSRIFNNIAFTVTCDNRGTAFPSGENVGSNWQGPAPPLLDVKARDFRPKQGSPLVDAGKVVPGVTDGYTGQAPDIGAYETGGEKWVPGIGWNCVSAQRRTELRDQTN